MRTRLICANWKMHLDRASITTYLEKLNDGFVSGDGFEVGLFAPSVYLSQMPGPLGDKVIWGAQNFYPEDKGAFTGEISLPMLKDISCPAVLVGHSERRGVFNESDELIALKMNKALNDGFKVVFCCGEALEIREKGGDAAFVRAQLDSAFAETDPEHLDRLSIAYEPIWAIGTGVTAEPGDAQAMSAEIRCWLKERFGDQIAEKMRILYGGSVKPGNIAEIMSGPDVDGSLVGGDSLDAGSFLEIIRNSL